jgi:hypothetical protein
MNDDLNNFVSGNYLSWKDKDTIEGVYVGFRVEKDPFGKKDSDKRAVYTLNIDGEEKQLGSKSKRLARAILDANPKFGDKIRIVRGGAGFDTVYGVEIVNTASVKAK